MLQTHDVQDRGSDVGQTTGLELGAFHGDAEGNGVCGVGGVDLAGLIEHHVGIAVVGGDQQHVVRVLLNFRDDAAHAGVHGLDRLDSRVHDTGVTDHVAVGKVADDQGVLVGGDGLHHLVADLLGAHLGHQVIGGELLRGGDQAAVLALGLLFHAAVEEEGHMGVLLGLSHAELLEALGADQIADGVLDDLGGIGDGESQRLVILGGADIGEGIDGLLALKAVKLRQVQRPGHLTGAVGAEVHEDHAVALVDDALRADNGGLDEFVRHILGIAGLDGVDGVGILHALAADDGVVAGLDPVPALVAVHAPEAALDSCDLRVAQFLALLLQLGHEAGAAAGRHVTAVQEAVDIDLLQAALLRHIKNAEDVLEVAVHAAGGEQTQDMQGFAILLGVVHGLDVDRVLEELAGLDLLGDLGQNLEHDAAGADVGVADLGVAHLAFGQTHVQTGGLQQGVGVLGKELIQVGFLRLGDGVARSGGGDAVAVHDDKDSFLHIQ